MHHCSNCGREIAYKGMCYFCKEKERLQSDLQLSETEKRQKLENLIKNIKRLDDFKEPESSDFATLYYLHGIVSEELQRAALDAELYFKSEIFYHAPADIRDELIRRLFATEDVHEAGDLMACVAMQGDDVALKALYELEQNPRPWRKGLYVGPSVYAREGGFTFDQEGKRIPIVYPDCYAIEQGNPDEDHALRAGQPHTGNCPHCGGQLMDILTLDGNDPRLRFLGITGKLSIPCCPNCVQYAYPFAFAKAVPDGESMPLFPYPEVEKEECYISEEERKQMISNKLVLSKEKKPPFYGLYTDEGDTVGGFGNWIQDCEVPTCPDCGKPMRLLAQLSWTSLCGEIAEGILYIYYCSDCHIAGMTHQQT